METSCKDTTDILKDDLAGCLANGIHTSGSRLGKQHHSLFKTFNLYVNVTCPSFNSVSQFGVSALTFETVRQTFAELYGDEYGNPFLQAEGKDKMKTKLDEKIFQWSVVILRGKPQSITRQTVEFMRYEKSLYYISLHLYLSLTG